MPLRENVRLRIREVKITPIPLPLSPFHGERGENSGFGGYFYHGGVFDDIHGGTYGRGCFSLSRWDIRAHTP